MKKIHLLALAACAASLMAAGCGQSNQTAQTTEKATPTSATENAVQPTDAPQACKYLDADIAKKYLGGELKDPEQNDTAGTVSTCVRMNDKIDGLVLLVRRSANGVEAATVNAGAIAESKGLSGVDPVMVTGLGDKAYWAGGKLNQMNVFKGRDWLILNGMMAGFDKDKAVEIMKDVLAKM